MSNYLRGHLKDSIADREGNVDVIIGTFANFVRHVRANEDFDPKDYVIINVEINNKTNTHKDKTL